MGEWGGERVEEWQKGGVTKRESGEEKEWEKGRVGRREGREE